MFHTNCLKDWFENIQITKDLTCPLCNTVITDTSETPNDDLECESNEVSVSMEFDTPGQKLQQNQDLFTNYVALISGVEMYRSKDTERADSDECITSNRYDDTFKSNI